MASGLPFGTGRLQSSASRLVCAQRQARCLPRLPPSLPAQFPNCWFAMPLSSSLTACGRYLRRAQVLSSPMQPLFAVRGGTDRG
jgi:hypothetical protein